ncbi:MAG: energy transducer TonB [Candidatus Sulfotelmatobacter sp.]
MTFRKDMGGAPEIRQAMPGGVPGCIYASKVRVSPGVMQSRLLEHAEPRYPAGIEKSGALILQLSIDKEGNVSSVEKISGPDALAPSAFDAVKKWKYRPYELNGAVVEVQTTVELKLPN